MVRVGLCHYKVGGTDGVSLEMEKWKAALERLGHQAVLCGGDLGTAEGHQIDELYHHRPDTERIRYNASSASGTGPRGSWLRISWPWLIE